MKRQFVNEFILILILLAAFMMTGCGSPDMKSDDKVGLLQASGIKIICVWSEAT